MEKHPSCKECQLYLRNRRCASYHFTVYKFYYYFYEDNFYHRNTGYIISLLIPVTAMLIDLSLLLQFRKNIRKKIFVSMLSYIVLLLVAAAGQCFHWCPMERGTKQYHWYVKAGG